MCKLGGVTYAPSEEVFWMHGHSTEQDFIYVTTQFMSKEMLTRISDEVGPDRSLLICCTAFRCDPAQFPNLTLKKIPNAVLTRCEWGKDDYSLSCRELACQAIGARYPDRFVRGDRSMNRDQVLEELRRHRPEIKARFAIKHLSVFGSAARDELREDSDIDVLVEFSGKATFDGYMDLKFYLENLLGFHPQHLQICLQRYWRVCPEFAPHRYRGQLRGGGRDTARRLLTGL
jgi:predicted nucleotidyltransferase